MELGCGQNVYFGGRGIPTKVDLTCYPSEKAFNRRVRKEEPQRTLSKSLSCSSQRTPRPFSAYSAVKCFLSVLAFSAVGSRFLREHGCQARCQELIGEIPSCHNHDRGRAFHFAGASKADADEHESPE